MNNLVEIVVLNVVAVVVVASSCDRRTFRTVALYIDPLILQSL